MNEERKHEETITEPKRKDERHTEREKDSVRERLNDRNIII